SDWLLWRGMAWNGRRSGGRPRQVIVFLLCVCVWQSGAESLRYSLAEEMERDSFVGNIAQDLGLAPSQLAARKARVVFEGSQQLFRLNPSSGVLTARESLDREEICPQSETCTLFFTVFFDNPLQLIRGEVEVLDVNDNSPTFSEKEMVFEIPETTSPGSRFLLDTAQDADAGSNALQNYILGSNSHFSLSLGTEKDGAKYAELLLDQQLDREEQKELNLRITAIDGGSPPRSGTAQIRIVVLDANDNTPMFSQEVYEVRLPENSPPGQPVVRVLATDPDEGSYGKVRYAFTQISKGSAQLFDLNPDTGEVRVVGNLDFEDTKNHKMVIKATDGGGNSAHCKVQVEVVDPALSVNAESGDVYALRSLDYERLRALEVRVRATDGGRPALSAQAVLRVLVRDENDNAPVVLHPGGESGAGELVPRWAPAGYLVAKVVAVDADAGQNAWLSYELAKATEPGLFRLAPHSGELRTARAVAERDAPRHRLVVLVRDRGQPPRSASATLAVALLHRFSDAHVRLSHEPPPAEPDQTLRLYLIACLACVSALCLATGLAALLIKVRRDRRKRDEPLPTFPTAVADSDAGSLPRSLVYDVCLATGTLSSDFRFLGPFLPCFPAEVTPGVAPQRSSVCSQASSRLGEGGD
ncbi:PCDB1 protein, partial [Tricholaema leucomelas]|nr:PCDB1 protein [Tricholaema leucomelas]